MIFGNACIAGTISAKRFTKGKMNVKTDFSPTSPISLINGFCPILKVISLYLGPGMLYFLINSFSMALSSRNPVEQEMCIVTLPPDINHLLRLKGLKCHKRSYFTDLFDSLFLITVL